jgi:hypothetical protein
MSSQIIGQMSDSGNEKRIILEISRKLKEEFFHHWSDVSNSWRQSYKCFFVLLKDKISLILLDDKFLMSEYNMTIV